MSMLFVRNFWNDGQGQDLIEYSLLIAFVTLASAGLFSSSGGAMLGIWTKVQARLAEADAGIK